ncbi:MAG: YchF family ATPase [Fimbriimonadaceae bacterium]|nr:YchF family ATPase [Fimbriimonadaceae bacterium]QYK56846.1 MAG: YchF family ATPase [Fimbriimonadaceae bacterium]
MKVGIIGFLGAGKSTLYRAASQGQAKGSVTAVPVPDPRFDAIVKQVQPKKQTPATVIFEDEIDDLAGTGKMFSQRCLDQARKADLLLHVVRAFESPMVPFHAEIDPLRDQEAVEVEMVLTDLQIIENRLERLAKSMNVRTAGHPDAAEKAVFDRIKGPLEEGTPIKRMDLEEEDEKVLRNYQFLSAKETVVVFNVGEDNASDPPAEIAQRIEQMKAKGNQAFAACATLEEEIASLDPADQPEFLQSMGLVEPASHRLVRAIYDALGLVTFFTAGENDTRAWPLRRGSSALKAAATIHNDIAKGFIRAEVVSYADYSEAGSLDAAYKSNKMRLEGKEYVVQDGDLLHIRNKS